MSEKTSHPHCLCGKSFEVQRPVRVLCLAEAPLLWLFLQVQWLNMIWPSLTRSSFLDNTIQHYGCSPHHVSINNFHGGREVKPCCYSTSGEWWLLPLWHFLLKNQGVMWVSRVSKPLLDQMSSSRELKRCTWKPGPRHFVNPSIWLNNSSQLQQFDF